MPRYLPGCVLKWPSSPARQTPMWTAATASSRWRWSGAARCAAGSSTSRSRLRLGANRTEERAVAPRQIPHTLLEARVAVELLAELQHVRVVQHGAQHPV